MFHNKSSRNNIECLGGFEGSWNMSKTTELISFNPPFSVQGPVTLKYPIAWHCSVLVHDKIYIFTFNTSISITVHNGAMDYDYIPKMPQYIDHHSCASFYDGNKTYIAVVGMWIPPIKTLIFDIEENVWLQGMKPYDNNLHSSENSNIFPNLTGPHFINQTDPCNTIITSPKGDGVVLVGKAYINLFIIF